MREAKQWLVLALQMLPICLVLAVVVGMFTRSWLLAGVAFAFLPVLLYCLACGGPPR